ncbi:MAG: glycosyltransferase family 4 protein [Terracidiphilus sp.]|jgi:glycosyltransferase involved in cell wall biosynthesis
MKQSAPPHHFFLELCEDIAGDEPAVIVSELESHISRQTRYLKGPPYDRRSSATRAISWIRFSLSALTATFRIGGKPTFFIVTQPPLLSLVGYLQFKLFKRRYVLWIDDVWPDCLVRQGMFGERSILVRLWKRFNRITYRYADQIISIGPCMLKNVETYASPATLLSVIPTWVDSNKIRPTEKSRNPFAIEHGQVNTVTVLYSGNMGVSHDMKSILEAARGMRNREDIHFMLIGAGAQFGWVQASVAEQKDCNITVLPLQPFEMLPYSLASGDIALVCMERGMEGISMPSKTYASLAAGSAILGICAKNSDLTELIKHCNCGRQVEPHDAQAIADALIAMVDDSLELARMKANGRRAAEERFSRAICVSKVRDSLERAERAGMNY